MRKEKEKKKYWIHNSSIRCNCSFDEWTKSSHFLIILIQMVRTCLWNWVSIFFGD
jgi:hypothetical protein